MYVNAIINKNTRHYIVLDLDKQKVIKDCQWADDISGKHCVYDKDKNGEYKWATDDLGRKLIGVNAGLKTVIKRSRIRLIDPNSGDMVSSRAFSFITLPKGMSFEELETTWYTQYKGCKNAAKILPDPSWPRA